MCELALAETLFNYMLADWMLRAESADAGGLLQQQIISLLERGRREKLSVAEMAREAGMCERGFSATRRTRQPELFDQGIYA